MYFLYLTYPLTFFHNGFLLFLLQSYSISLKEHKKRLDI